MDVVTLERGKSVDNRAEILVAACSGTQLLSTQIGLPVVHIDVSRDAEAELGHLRRSRYGCGGLWPGGFQPLLPENGWDDWRQFEFDGSPDLGGRPLGVSISGKRLMVTLGKGTSIDEMREQLAGSLRHVRVQDVVKHPSWLAARQEIMATIVVHPRYALPRYPEIGGARLLKTLYVIDPAEDVARLVWLVAAARLAANEKAIVRWR